MLLDHVFILEIVLCDFIHSIFFIAAVSIPWVLPEPVLLGKRPCDEHMSTNFYILAFQGKCTMPSVAAVDYHRLSPLILWSVKFSTVYPYRDWTSVLVLKKKWSGQLMGFVWGARMNVFSSLLGSVCPGSFSQLQTQLDVVKHGTHIYIT